MTEERKSEVGPCLIDPFGEPSNNIFSPVPEG